MSFDDEDSEQLHIEPPKEEKARINSLISSWEFQVCCPDPLEAKIYLVVSDVYLRNLISKKEEPKLNESQRKRLGLQCLIVQEFQLQWMSEDGHHRNIDSYRSQLSITHEPYKGLNVVLRLGELAINSDDTVQAKLIYHAFGEDINYKTYRLEFIPDQPTNAMSFLIEDRMFDTYIKPKLAIEFTIKKEPERMKKFRGIQNEGNTCYMNSTLQILYFLRPLRKAIIEFEGKGELMSSIKKIFIDLLDLNSQSAFLRSVDASDLLSAYGKFPDPRKQQDIHQFLLGFLDELEGQLPQLKELWLGKSRQILNSRDPEKPYESKIDEDFNELDLLLEDHRGNTLGRMTQSLYLLLDEQLMDDKIETDEYGKVEVGKIRQFGDLPNVVFFNLKRYKYRKGQNRPVKILTDFQYPSSINLAFLQGTPTGDDEDYVLFGVTVHRGLTYNSGHYYSFVNTSQDPNTPYWIKFNDSFVIQSSQETALGFTGGKHKTVNWSKEYERFLEKEYISEQTAYLLTYIRRDKFREYQSLQTTIPRDWVLKRREQHKLNSTKSQQVYVVLFEEKMDCDIYDEALPVFPLSLNDDEEVHQQLSKIGPSVFGCRVGSIWKVCRKMKKIKLIQNYIDLPQTPSRIFTFRRGHSIPDFLLVVPQGHQIYRPMSIENRGDKLGIVSILLREEKTTSRWLRVMSKNYIQEYKTEQETKLSKVGYFEDKDRFLHDWTDYCAINFD